jgi:hypothetical protein
LAGCANDLVVRCQDKNPIHRRIGHCTSSACQARAATAKIGPAFGSAPALTSYCDSTGVLAAAAAVKGPTALERPGDELPQLVRVAAATRG